MKLAIIGGGNMGTAFGVAFQNSNLVKPENIYVVEPREEQREFLKQKYAWNSNNKICENLKNFDVVILALKPQDYKDPCVQLASYIKDNTLVISVMTGIQIDELKRILGTTKIIRCMPNTPVLINQGVTAYLIDPEVDQNSIDLIETILNQTGIAIKVDNSDLIDAATSLSASGAGFVFYLIENILKAGKELGFDELSSEKITYQTILGSLELWKSSQTEITELRSQVTSKGGTTAAGVEVLENAQVGKALIDAFVQAKNRAKELSRNN
ncbi:MAG: pyrroline-5-carboxylate reductase [Bdellovibrionales bacterium]|nr:pyrroline-5-carboxylate reductase [Bdellovibrionales bacterium]